MSNDAMVRAKLVRAYQSLLASSSAYDSGCMEIKEILDEFLSERAVYTKKYTESDLQEKLRQQREVYTRMTMCAYYGENGEHQGVMVPIALLHELEAALDNNGEEG